MRVWGDTAKRGRLCHTPVARERDGAALAVASIHRVSRSLIRPDLSTVRSSRPDERLFPTHIQRA